MDCLDGSWKAEGAVSIAVGCEEARTVSNDRLFFLWGAFPPLIKRRPPLRLSFLSFFVFVFTPFSFRLSPGTLFALSFTLPPLSPKSKMLPFVASLLLLLALSNASYAATFINDYPPGRISRLYANNQGGRSYTVQSTELACQQRTEAVGGVGYYWSSGSSGDCNSFTS